MVAGADDIRVAVLEDYLLEHALYSLGVPNKLLIFPGEGHSLDKESLARKDQSAGRIEVAAEIRRRASRELTVVAVSSRGRRILVAFFATRVRIFRGIEG